MDAEGTDSGPDEGTESTAGTSVGTGQSDSAEASHADGGAGTRQDSGEQRAEATGKAEAGSGTATEDAGTDSRSEPSNDDQTAAESDEADEPGRSTTDSTTAGDERIRRLRALDEGAFTEFVASVWSARGYTTTVFSATKKAVYDIIAMQRDPEKRFLIWAVHRPDGGSLGSTAVERCATARDSSQGADGATLVTSGLLTDAARDRAAELDVTVVDCEDLLGLLETLDLDSLLEEE